MLHPDPTKGDTCLIHTLIQNNKTHLLRQFAAGIDRVVQSAVAYLSPSLGSDPLRTAMDGEDNSLGQNLQTGFELKLK